MSSEYKLTDFGRLFQTRENILKEALANQTQFFGRPPRKTKKYEPMNELRRHVMSWLPFNK
jgi:hypothetical protein